jgi:hypothetical protein
VNLSICAWHSHDGNSSYYFRFPRFPSDVFSDPAKPAALCAFWLTLNSLEICNPFDSQNLVKPFYISPVTRCYKYWSRSKSACFVNFHRVSCGDTESLFRKTIKLARFLHCIRSVTVFKVHGRLKSRNHCRILDPLNITKHCRPITTHLKNRHKDFAKLTFY